VFKQIASRSSSRLFRPIFERRCAAIWQETPVEIRYWDGRRFQTGQGPPRVTMELRDPAVLLALLADPSLGFGNSYTDGRLRIDGDLQALLGESFQHAFWKQPAGMSTRTRKWLRYFKNLPILRGQAVRNARHHYDQGNVFFRRWLDPSMSYSCAYFRTPEDDIQQAQTQKLELICRKLRLQPEQSLLDVGCGWGALLFHAIEHYGVHGVGVTPSRQQSEFIRAEAERRGIGDRLTLHTADWREITGRYDRVVSVGMFEHVGKACHGRFLRRWREWLKPGGVSLLHTIGTMHALPPDPWIERNIFPGGYLPSLGEITRHASSSKLLVADLENLWQHYDLTLARWIENFGMARDELEKMTSESFARMWWLYLHASRAAFRTGRCHLWQLILTSDKTAPHPLTRDEYRVPAAHAMPAEPASAASPATAASAPREPALFAPHQVDGQPSEPSIMRSQRAAD